MIAVPRLSFKISGPPADPWMEGFRAGRRAGRWGRRVANPYEGRTEPWAAGAREAWQNGYERGREAALTGA